MIGDIKSPLARITKDRLVIGLDISDEFSQVSYSYVDDDEPKTLSMKVGGEDMCIPTMLGKFYSQNVWTFGDKAVEMADNNEGYVITDLLFKAREGRPVEVEGREYDPVDLLALFMKKCLSLLSMVAPLEKVSVIVITVEEPDSKNIAILTKAINTLRIKPEKVFFQSYSESIFNYIIHQKKELWNHDVIVCHLKEDEMVIRGMKTNQKATPNVVMMEEKQYSTISAKMLRDGKEVTKNNLDTLFTAAVQTFCMDTYVSSIYLLGSGFEDKWYNETLKYLCQNRRVFLGNNLFSKGACYGAKDKIIQSEECKNNVFIGKDKVRANVGIVAYKDNEESYVSLLEAGKNWYETFKECEFIIDDTDKVEFVVTPLDGKDSRVYSVYLDGLPKRPAKATRVKLELKMKSDKILEIIITDLGFGEFFPPTGQRFRNEIVLE